MENHSSAGLLPRPALLLWPKGLSVPSALQWWVPPIFATEFVPEVDDIAWQGLVTMVSVFLVIQVVYCRNYRGVHEMLD